MFRNDEEGEGYLMENKAELAIIVPCYNEQEVLPKTIRTLTELRTDLIKKELISKSSKLVFVNDGSKDATWDIITKEHIKKAYIKGICFSRNFGHQAALLAGMYNVDAETKFRIF